jgi:ribose transport system substrate-binding protein
VICSRVTLFGGSHGLLDEEEEMQAGSAVERGKPGLTSLAALLLLVLALVAAGCGGDDDESGSGSGGAASSSGQDVVAKAQEVIDPYLEPPGSVGTDEALSKKPPTGKKVIALSCTLEVCKNWRDQVAIAAQTLGWTAKGISFDGTPEDTLKKVNQAVSESPDGIIINGVPRETYEAAAKAAADNNIPIVTQMGELEGEATPPFIAVQDRAEQFDKMAAATGNWVIADSQGKANALVLAYANFPLSERIAETTKKTIDDNCPDCSTKELRVQAADTGTKLPANVVSEIQRDPSTDYVVLQDAAMAGGLDAALREAGLTEKVKVLGNNVTPEVIQSTLEGTNLGWMAFSLRAAAYQAVDALARHFVGDEQVDLPLMNQILTKETLPPNPTPDTWENLPPDLADQYKKLWQVG